MSSQALQYEIETEYGLDAYLAIARAQTNHTHKRLAVGYLTTGFLFALVFLYVFVVGMDNLFRVLPWLIVFGLFAFVILTTGWHLDRTVAKRLWKKNHKYVSNVSYRFFSDHLEADNPKDMSLTYENIFALRETDGFFLLYSSENAVNALAKNGFKKGNPDSFRTFLQTATKKEWEVFS